MTLPLILDCTFRDGGYMNDWRFKDRVVREVYKAVSNAGVDYIEIGFHGTTEFFDPAKFGTWRFSSEDAIRGATNGVMGSRIALMVDFGKFRTDDLPPAAESAVQLIRIAVHSDSVRQAAEQAAALHLKGYEVSLNLMGIATYSPARWEELEGILADVPLDYAYIGDTYGSILPDQVGHLIESLRAIGDFKVGFHPHNNLQMAFANTLEAIRCGIDIVDASLYGIGRGAGNLPIETLVAYLQTKEPERYNVLPLLNMVDRYFVDQQRETPWGYQLPYMLSGLFNVHPNYAQGLMDPREYSMEDVWKALQLVRQANPVGFNPGLIDGFTQRGFVGRPAGREAGAGGGDPERSLPPRPPVTYENAHEGRDFLVLANGPTLSSHAEEVRAFIDQYEPVVLGANHLGGLFVPHYHAFNNTRRLIEYLDEVQPDSTLLLGSNFEETLIREHTGRSFDWLVFDNGLGPFDIVDGVITASCRTISVLLCGVALVMGARRIFIAGMDGYLGLDTSGQVHFYNEADETSSAEVELEKHRLCYQYLGQINDYAEAHGKEGLHILTPTGYAAYYTGVRSYLERAQPARGR